jgi:hypothetical protein
VTGGVANARPILVTGSHRSGSTWVGRTLAADPSIGYISEPFHVRHQPGICAATFRHWYTYVTHENEAAFRSHLARTLTFRYRIGPELVALPRLWWEGRTGRVRPAGDTMTQPPLPRPARRTIREGAGFLYARARRARPLLKDPMALFSSEWLAESFGVLPVVVVRHPAAFAGSLKRLDWHFPFAHFLEQPLLMRDFLHAFEDEIRRAARHPLDVVDEAILLWRIVHAAISSLRARHGDWVFVRHEDLSTDPFGGFRALTSRLEIDFGPQVRAAIAHSTASSNPVEAPVGAVEHLLRDSRANVDNWRHRLTAAEIERVRTGTSDLAERFYTQDEW